MTWLAGESLLISGKLAKSRSTSNIALTKPERYSGEVVRLGMIERNPKRLGQYSEALAAQHVGKLCDDLFGKIRLVAESGGQMFKRIILTGVRILLKNLATFTDGTAFRGVTKQRTL